MADLSTYTVGWICALTTELVAAKSFFDEEYEVTLEAQAPGDNNCYSFGRMGRHDVVVASLPRAEYGIAPAASVARDMLRTFPNIRVGLMVGIGGGAPSPQHDIRLGDVVVSVPSGAKGGVIHYNRGKTVQQQDFQLTGSLNRPPQFLLTAVVSLEANYRIRGHELNERIEEVLNKYPRLKKRYARPSAAKDRLYESSHIHRESPKSALCKDNCGEERLITRNARGDDDDDPMIHYGLIASSDKLMKDATIRDKLAMEEGVLCFEMATVLHPKNQRLKGIICNAAIANPKVSERTKAVLEAALDSRNNQFVEYLCDQEPLPSWRQGYYDLKCIDAFFEVLLGEHRHYFQLLIEKGTKHFVKSLGAPLSPLVIAAFNGHADIVKELIESGIDTVSEQLILYCAIAEGHDKVLQVLLDHDFNVNARIDSPTCYGLISVRRILNIPDRLEFLRRDVSYSDYLKHLRLNPDHLTPLKPAEGLEQNSFNVALWWALLRDKEVVVQMLLDHGAEFHGVDLAYNTALHLASSAGFQQTVKGLLRKGADIHAVNRDGKIPLYFASVDVAEVLVGAGADIEAKDNQGWTVLHHASDVGDVNMLKFLASQRADFSARTPQGSNALHVAHATWLIGYSTAGIVDIFNCLLENGVNVMVVDEDGLTPLHKACLYPCAASARLLIKAGANIHARDKKGRTPLHGAVHAMNDTSFTLVSYLLERGACVNDRDNQGWTALHHTVDFYIDSSTICIGMIELILDNSADINAQDINGETTVFRAFCRRSDFHPAKLLLERGADVNIPNNEGDTILHQGSDVNLALLKMLLHHGGDVNILNNKGDSPLASALMKGKKAEHVADMLISWGAKDIRNGQEQAN